MLYAELVAAVLSLKNGAGLHQVRVLHQDKNPPYALQHIYIVSQAKNGAYMLLLTNQAELLGRYHPVGSRCHFHQALDSRFISASISYVTTLDQDRNMDQRIIRGYARNRVDDFIHLPMFACRLLLEMVHGILWRFTSIWKMPTSHTSIPWHTPNFEHSIGSVNFVSSRTNNLESECPESPQGCYSRCVFPRCFRYRLWYHKNRDDFPRY